MWRARTTFFVKVRLPSTGRKCRRADTYLTTCDFACDISHVGTSLRLCTLCDQPYQAGRYREHAGVHTPVRSRPTPRRVSPARERAIQLLSMGMSHSEVARAVGLTRQRIGQIAHELDRVA